MVLVQWWLVRLLTCTGHWPHFGCRNDAEAGRPDATFQFEQQPFAFFANFSPSSPLRSHLQDEQDFFDAVRNGSLPQVSFIKPLGKQVRTPYLSKVLIRVYRAVSRAWARFLTPRITQLK